MLHVHKVDMMFYSTRRCFANLYEVDMLDSSLCNQELGPTMSMRVL